MINNIDTTISDSLSTEERILLAAESEFMQKGFAGARTTAIAEAAGVTHAMLHYYFRTKENLFSKIIEEKISAISKSFLIRIDDDKPLTESIRAAVEHHFDFLRNNPSIPKFLVNDVFPNPDLFNQLKGKIGNIAKYTLERLQKIIDASAANGECRPLNAHMLIIDIISLNVFPILAMPLLKSISENIVGIDIDTLLDTRREENVQTVLRKLFPL